MEKKKMSNGKKVLIGIAIIGIIGMIGSSLDDKKPDATAATAKEVAVQQPKDWKKMTYEEHEAWINNYLQHPDDNGYAMVSYMGDAVKNKFNYPKEVDFDWGQAPILNHGRVVEADLGLVFFEGKGTAKNAFGVKSGFRYSLRTIIRPDSLKIDKVSVTEEQ